MKNPMNNPNIEYGGGGGTSGCHFPNYTANSSNNGIRCEVKWWTQLSQQLLTTIVGKRSFFLKSGFIPLRET